MRKAQLRRSRRFLSRNTSVSGLFAQLNAAGCRYTVLRWFETLPIVETGEDIDILVHDEDVDLLRGFLSRKSPLARLLGRRNVKCDIYSVSGVVGSTFRGVAYYPPHLATRILEGAIRHESGALVPNPHDHFYSLAFHALYHKGLRSGLPVTDEDLCPETNPEHDYTRRLRQLADEIHLRVDIEMDALDEKLAAEGWRPPLDLLERLLPTDPWARTRINVLRSATASREGLAVFVLRQRALQKDGMVQSISELLREDGFNVLAIKHLSVEQMESLGRELRGGNWGRGPWAVSGGLPAVAIVAIDVFPSAPSRKLLRNHPEADNERVFNSKQRIRDWANHGLLPTEKCNIIHSSDNSAQAAAYVALIMPELQESILRSADELLAQTRASGRVVRRFDRSGRRAIVELIRNENGYLVVRKRFRPGSEVYFERELQALKALRNICPDVVPPILAHGHNYVVVPFLEDGRSKLARRLGFPLPLRAVRKAFAAAQQFLDNGYVLADFRPHNLIIERGGGLKIIDYERTYDCRGGGLSIELVRKLPFDIKKYQLHWARVVGLSLHSILYDPLWLAFVKRWSIGPFIVFSAALAKGGRNLKRRYQKRLQKLAVHRSLASAAPGSGASI